MTEHEQKKIFSENLTNLIQQSGKEQKQIAIDLNENPSTFNQWVKGKALPSVPKVHSIANYFGVPFESLVDKKQGSTPDFFVKTSFGKILLEEHQGGIRTDNIRILLEYYIRILKHINKLNEDGMKKLEERLEELVALYGKDK